MKQNNYNNKVIGLTGGIATGKSTTTEILFRKGYPVIDADKISHNVVKTGQPAYNEIVSQFGKEILNEDMSLDRKKLGKIIFNDRDRRNILNNIVHPKVTYEIKKEIEVYKKNNDIIFVDIPLLIENKQKLESEGILFNEVWLVYTDEETQLQRLMKRDNINKEEAKSKINSQMSIEAKKKYANVIINNSNNINLLIKNIEEAIEHLK
ncbi:dephospho-CoA kinase [Dethiothermospora halolimnae]|uniref:dephospho-CoA kinase n=1 Tax=Dethiothermospora halolimnae TaxID=3114390 RepID=UPI003CCC01C3